MLPAASSPSPDRLSFVRAELDRRAMAALSVGHLATDFAGGSLPALLPFLVSKFDLSYTLAAVLMLASTLAASVIQPVFGLWSDRRGALWLLPTGVALCAIGMGLAAAAPAYWAVVVLVVASGLGSAAYHPEGSKFAAYASGARRASGMSVFAVGGNVGVGLGAAVTTPIVVWLGLRGGLLIAVPGIFVALMLVRLRPFLGSFAPETPAHATARAGGDDVRALLVLIGVILFRAVAWFGLITFVPLYEISLGHSKSYGNHLLSLMLLVGAAGTLFMGPCADRFGRRTVMVVTSAVTGPLIAVFVVLGGALGAIALAGVGLAVVGTFGVTTIMAQEYLPSRIAMASGLSIGFSIGLGGVAAVALGAVADSVDLRAALWIAAAAPAAAFVLSLRLPARRFRARLTPEVVAP